MKPVCAVQSERRQLSPDARSEPSVAVTSHETQANVDGVMIVYLKQKGHAWPSAGAVTPKRELSHAVRPGTGTRV